MVQLLHRLCVVDAPDPHQSLYCRYALKQPYCISKSTSSVPSDHRSCHVFVSFIFLMLSMHWLSGRQGFGKFLLQQRTVCVFYFTIMLFNYVICFANIMSILRTSLRTQFMANLL